MKRRAFLHLAGLAAAGSMTHREVAAGAAPAWQASAPPADVVVIGAGAFGGWAALHLREMGASVTLVDAFGPGNPRAASGGETRQIRVGYGEQEIYSRWVLRAMERWQAREQEFGRTLLTKTGRLQMAPEMSASMKATREVFDRLNVRYEVLSPGDLRRRYPQIDPQGMGAALLEPDAGVLRAFQACLVVAESVGRKGGQLVSGRAEPGRAEGGRMQHVAISGGRTLAGGAFVFACGPWLRKIFPDLLGRKLSTPRRDVFFFGTPPGDERFTHPNLPNYSEPSYYGFPSLDGKGLKVCPVGENVEFDPDDDERIVAAWQVRRARDYLARRFPAMKDQPIVETRVCQLENTVDEHFIVQRHPAWENVWIAGGGSGHGFKHGPVVGEHIARRVLGRDTEPELDALFRIKEGTF